MATLHDAEPQEGHRPRRLDICMGPMMEAAGSIQLGPHTTMEDITQGKEAPAPPRGVFPFPSTWLICNTN